MIVVTAVRQQRPHSLASSAFDRVPGSTRPDCRPKVLRSPSTLPLARTCRCVCRPLRRAAAGPHVVVTRQWIVGCGRILHLATTTSAHDADVKRVAALEQDIRVGPPRQIRPDGARRPTGSVCTQVGYRLSDGKRLRGLTGAESTAHESEPSFPGPAAGGPPACQSADARVRAVFRG
jgi:hypothetical protein